MEYFFTLLVSTAALMTAVEGKIPEYIRVCKRNDPELTKCIKNNILNLREKLVQGIPELSVPPIDPLHLDTFVVNLGSGFKTEAKNLTLTGGKNFKIDDLDVDINANIYTFNVSIPQIVAKGTYDVDAKIAAIAIKGTGPLTLIAKNIAGRGTLHGKMVKHGGIIYNWFPTLTLKLRVGDYEIKLDGLVPEDPTIGEVTNKLLNEEKTEVIAGIIPGFEKTLIPLFLRLANNICKNFSWDELFPET